MDDETRQQWKWKFYRVALHLNAVILFIALTVIAALLAPENYRAASVAILVILDIVLTVSFRNTYIATKQWLDAHGNPKRDE
jgi:uncharacterized membrane-anchored protein